MRRYGWLVYFSIIGCIVLMISCMKVQEEPVSVVTNISEGESRHKPVEVLIYIGSTSWITIEYAAVEAATTKNLLANHGIRTLITSSDESVKNWMLQTTDNGVVNVCILYGVLPSTIYASGNIQSDDSIAENWIESTDGDTILNQGDYLGYYSSDGTPNYKAALQNLMDLPKLDLNVENFENLPMLVTESGKTITPSLGSFESDRPFPLGQLGSTWYVEKIVASNSGDDKASSADPIILRDGDKGRTAMVQQTHHGNERKGEVAAEIIVNYLLAK